MKGINIMDGIYNAKIKNMWIQKRYPEERLKLELEIKSTEGSACMSFEMSQIEKIFDILEIYDIKDIINSPCIVLIYNGMMKDIGRFLFIHYDGRSFSDEEKDWVFNDQLRKKIFNYAD